MIQTALGLLESSSCIKVPPYWRYWWSRPWTIKLGTSVGWWAWASASGKRKPASYDCCAEQCWRRRRMLRPARPSSLSSPGTSPRLRTEGQRRTRGGDGMIAPDGEKKQRVSKWAHVKLRRKNGPGASSFGLQWLYWNLPNYPYHK